MTNRWIPFPDDRDNPRFRWPLEDGDSYLVRTKEGVEIWAVYDGTDDTAFFPCDDFGTPLSDEPVEVVALAMSETSIVGPRYRFPVVPA